MSRMSKFLDARPGKARRIGFVVAVVLSTLSTWVVFGSIFAFFMPWIPNPPEGPGYAFPEAHRWHDAQYGAHTAMLFGGSMALLLWRRARTALMMQFVVLTALVYAAVCLIGGEPEGLVAPLFAVVLVALYPNRRELLAIRSDSWNVPLLIIGVVATAVALRYSVDMFRLQMNAVPGDEHAEFFHWGMAMLVTLTLLLAALFAATGRPGSRAIGVLGGAAFIYLGIAALTSLDGGRAAPVGIWSTSAAIMSLLAGIGYIGATLLHERLAALLPWSGPRTSTAR